MDEYQTMVQRELMLLRARKEAEELFQKEELEKERNILEEKMREKANQLTNEFIRILQRGNTDECKRIWILLNSYLTKYGAEKYSISLAEFAERAGIHIHE
jgi:hypothetical protein